MYENPTEIYIISINGRKKSESIIIPQVALSSANINPEEPLQIEIYNGKIIISPIITVTH